MLQMLQILELWINQLRKYSYAKDALPEVRAWGILPNTVNSLKLTL